MYVLFFSVFSLLFFLPLAWEAVNKAVLQAALQRRKKVTLDIDATEVVANKADAHWTYN
jgi:hypothetical protein